MLSASELNLSLLHLVLLNLLPLSRPLLLEEAQVQASPELLQQPQSELNHHLRGMSRGRIRGCQQRRSLEIPRWTSNQRD